MKKEDVALTFYEAARAEMLERIRLRENIILFYVGAVATLLGVAFGKDQQNNEILFVIPLLSLAASILVSHHNSLIGALGLYCSVELKDSLVPSCNTKVVQWDESQSLITSASTTVRNRLLPHLLIISFPAVIALIVNRRYLFASDYWFCTVWLLGAACFICSIFYIAKSGYDRKKTFDAIGTNSKVSQRIDE